MSNSVHSFISMSIIAVFDIDPWCFQPFYGGRLHKVTGEVKSPSGETVQRVSGEWNASLDFTSVHVSVHVYFVARVWMVLFCKWCASRWTCESAQQELILHLGRYVFLNLPIVCLSDRARRWQLTRPSYRSTRNASVQWVCRTRWSHVVCGIMSLRVCVRMTLRKPLSTNVLWVEFVLLTLFQLCSFRSNLNLTDHLVVEISELFQLLCTSSYHYIASTPPDMIL